MISGSLNLLSPLSPVKVLYVIKCSTVWLNCTSTSDHDFVFYVSGRQGGKSDLNPKAPAFFTFGKHSSTSISYSQAIIGNMTRGKGTVCLCFVYAPGACCIKP